MSAGAKAPALNQHDPLGETSMYRIHCDVSITRRKRYLIITDENGDTVFRAKTMAQIIRWMDAEEQSEYQLCLEASEPVLHCERLTEPLGE